MSVANAPIDNTPRKRRSGRLAVVTTQIGILALILGTWQFAVSDASLPYFSRPTIVAAKLLELLSQPQIYRHISVTLTEIAIGYALGAGLGLSLGFILGRSQFLSAALRPTSSVSTAFQKSRWPRSFSSG